MKLIIKRPIRLYIYRGLWAALTIIYATKDLSNLANFIWTFLACEGIVAMIAIIKRNYFEIKGEALIINESFFKRQIIKLRDINRVEIGPTPYLFSTIYLKNREHISYSGQSATGKEVRELLAQFNIPVE